MMVIDFTPVLYLIGWGLVLLLVVAGGGIISCLSNDGRKARTWVETGDFVRSLRSNGVGQRGSRGHADRASSGSPVCADASGSRARCALLALVGSAAIASAVGVAHAGTIRVDPFSTTGGPGCTLRDAITAANLDRATGRCSAGSDTDTIELPTANT